MLFLRDTNSNNVLDHFHYYNYQPSMAAAVIFTILFGSSTLFHSFQMLKGRTWFMIPFLIGGICKSTTSFVF